MDRKKTKQISATVCGKTKRISATVCGKTKRMSATVCGKTKRISASVCRKTKRMSASVCGKSKRILGLAAIAVLASALIALSGASVSADGQERVNGLRPVHKDVYKVPGDKVSGAEKSKKKLKKESQLPAAYRSDQQDWAAGIKVKDQGNAGLCWAFSMTTAAEYSYAKELYEKGGSAGESAAQSVRETSPGHLGWFFYNRASDPLGLTAGDKNLVPDGYSWLDGGSQLEGMQHLATWSGLAREGSAPYDYASLINNHIKDEGWDGTTPYDRSKAYADYITQEESIMYLNGTDDVTIKDLVYRYGAVSAGIDYDNSAVNKYTSEKSHGYFKYDKDADINHAVTIVGWDDEYPRENFRHKVSGKSEEEAYSLTTPQNDGAWVVQNSWGDEEGDKGFIYVSYESYGISTDSTDSQDPHEGPTDISAYDMQPADAYNYNFQYDGTADYGDSSDSGNENFFTAEGTSAANIYTNTKDWPISIKAAGFTVFNEGRTDYEISIYTGISDPKDPTSGVLKGTTRYSSYTPGAKTAVLDEPVYVGAGTKFSIVFSFEGNTYFGVEKKRNATYTVQTSPKQSFFRKSEGAGWKDIHYDGNGPACFRIKGFATETEKDVRAAKIKKAKKATVKIKGKALKKRRAKLTWKKPSGISGYVVYKAAKKSGKYKKVATLKAKAKSWTSKKIKTGKKAFFKVRAYTTIGKTRYFGKWSNAAAVKLRK